jgi:uncharacterized protein (DUF1330 family)
MTVYAIALLNTLDPLWNLSAGGRGDLLYSGKLLAVDEASTVKEGDWPYTRTVLVEFPGDVCIGA